MRECRTMAFLFRAHLQFAVLRAGCADGLLACAALIALLTSPFPANAQTAEVEAKFRPALKERVAKMGASETVRFSVIIDPGSEFAAMLPASKRERVRLRQQEIIERVPASELEILRRYENLSGFSGRGGAASVKALAAHPWVSSIYIDGHVNASLAQGVPLVAADRAAALGFAGSGVTVAILDTGIDTDHPDLVDDLLEERCWCSGGAGPFNGCCPNGADTMSGAGAAEDGSGHGTNVSGIVTSGGVVSADGVAPDSGIVAIKVLSDAGGGSFSDVDSALDWVITNHAAYDIRVINLSLGDGTEYADPLAFPCTGTVTTTAISDLVDAGITVIVASGNDGFDAGIAFPACVPGAISVGGVYDANVGSISWCGPTSCTPALCVDSSTAPDQFVCHSNSSSALDILAPDWRTRTSAVGGGVANFGGTSAAAPYVSGLAALLIEQDPSRESADLLALMTGAAPLVLNPDNGLSFPRADVSTAFPDCGDGVVEIGEECDDGNVLAGDCCSATCVFEAAGTSCDDGDACTAPDQCDAIGACTQSTPVVCDDSLFCNGAETCDIVLGCQPGTPPTVDDGVACTDDSCDEVGGAVVHSANASLCDDSLFCNGAETCDIVLDCQAGT
ncbi:MAG TPA: hypothetical protein EYQ54_15395, partial [Myxococcales bacterium]|nr:hypothetical protein [Myxococcales bacterium]